MPASATTTPYSALYVPLQSQVENTAGGGSGDGGSENNDIVRETYDDGIFLRSHPGFRSTGTSAGAGAGAGAVNTGASQPGASENPTRATTSRQGTSYVHGDDDDDNNDDADDDESLHTVLGPNRTTFLAGLSGDNNIRGHWHGDNNHHHHYSRLGDRRRNEGGYGGGGYDERDEASSEEVEGEEEDDDKNNSSGVQVMRGEEAERLLLHPPEIMRAESAARRRERRHTRRGNRETAPLWAWGLLSFLLGASVILATARFRTRYSRTTTSTLFPFSSLPPPPSQPTNTATTMLYATPLTPYEEQARKRARKLQRKWYGPSYMAIPSHVVLQHLARSFIDECLMPVVALVDELGISPEPDALHPKREEIESWTPWIKRGKATEGEGNGKREREGKGERKGEKGGKGKKARDVESREIEIFCHHLSRAADMKPSSSADASADPSENEAQAKADSDTQSKSQAMAMLLHACHSLPFQKRKIRSRGAQTLTALYSLRTRLGFLKPWLRRMRGDTERHYAPVVLDSDSNPRYAAEEMRLGQPYQQDTNDDVWRELRRGLCGAPRAGEDDYFEEGAGRLLAGPPWSVTLNKYAADLAMLRRDLERLWGAVLFSRAKVAEGKEPVVVELPAAEEEEEKGRNRAFLEKWRSWVPWSGGREEKNTDRLADEEEEKKRKKEKERVYHIHYNLLTIDTALDATRDAADTLDGLCADLAVLRENDWSASAAGYTGRKGDWPWSSSWFPRVPGQGRSKEEEEQEEQEKKKEKEDNVIMIWTPWHVDRIIGALTQAVDVLQPLVAKKWKVFW